MPLPRRTYRDCCGLPIHDEPLTVHIYEGTTDKQAGYVNDAVRIIDAALPREWELTISEEDAGRCS